MLVPAEPVGSVLPTTGTCRAATFPVAVDGRPQTIVGELCMPGGCEARPLVLMLSGATYDRSYWDFPHEPEQYSFVRAITGAGYATLALDRLGTGASDWPPFTSLTVSAQGEALHEIVDLLRAQDWYASAVTWLGATFAS